MAVAALYDIHGNLPALEAVLDDVRAAGVDRIVAGGDLLLGPMPRESLHLLMDCGLPVQYIHGNCEREMLVMMAGGEPVSVPPAVRALLRWTADQLDPADTAFVRPWPGTLRLTIPGLGNVLFCHATPRNDTEIFTKRTPDDRLRPIFDDVGVPLVVCGHTHMQFDRTVGATRIVNAGSVGMSFAGPGAFWLLLGDGIELRRTTYDLDRAAARIRATTYPQADDFATRHVLHPPAEDAMLDALGKAELS